MMKNIKWIVIGVLSLLLIWGGWRAYNYVTLGAKSHIEVNSTVMLERVREVSKLVTVEGYFSEIYDYKDYYFMDILPLRKKALIRVKAKVSVGTDLTEAEMIADESIKTLFIKKIPPAEILSIDHSLDYYDLQDGVFNNFSEKDYNKVNTEAKDFIRTQAEKSELMAMADERLVEYLKFIESIVASGGWTLEWTEAEILD